MEYLTQVARKALRMILGHHNSRTCKGNDNQIAIDRHANVNHCNFRIIGNGNRVIIDERVNLSGVLFTIAGDNNLIHISECCKFENGCVLWIEDNYCKIEVGKHSTFVQVHLAATENNSSIIIGENCMFSNDIDIRTSDSHSIIDKNSGERINYAQNVAIGKHVWVGAHSSILKGADVPDDVIIATRSTVTRSINHQKDFSEGVIVAGTPAKVVRKCVNWDWKRL